MEQRVTRTSFCIDGEFQMAGEAFSIIISQEILKRDFILKKMTLDLVQGCPDTVQSVFHLRAADPRQWSYTIPERKR